MTAKRSNEYVAPKKQKATYREPSPKKLRKIHEQQLLYDLAKQCFNRSLKSVDVQTRQRRKENYFKIKIKGFAATDQISLFHNKLQPLIGNYKFSFDGTINVKTGKEELFLHVTIFNQEEHYETEGSSHSGECSKAECISGVFGQTEVCVGKAFLAS